MSNLPEKELGVVLYMIQQIETIEDFLKLASLDGQVGEQTAREILRLLHGLKVYGLNLSSPQNRESINYFGYFDNPEQTTPAYDPGPNSLCPLCMKPLSGSWLRTISLMRDGDKRSYFYRLHKACYESSTPEQITKFESLLIDFPLTN